MNEDEVLEKLDNLIDSISQVQWWIEKMLID